MQRTSPYLAVILLLLACPVAKGQFTTVPEYGILYRPGEIARFDIQIDPAKLDSIYQFHHSDREYRATMIYTSAEFTDTVEDVGFRVRGAAARHAHKKNFKIAINSFEKRKWLGVEKINLNSHYNDPTISRAYLCSQLLRKRNLPGPRSTHATLFINGEYYGLYLNEEHIDEEFADLYFGSKMGNLYKCTYPADLLWHGEEQEAYKHDYGYELKTNEEIDDWSAFVHFINVLNNTPLAEMECALQEVFNIDRYLRYMAFDVMVGHWDGPLFNKNNFYLYHDPSSGKFEYIPYDFDNTYGTDWTGRDWGRQQIYNWSKGAESPPLYARIMAIPAFRAKFSEEVRQLLVHFESESCQPLLDSLQIALYPYAAEDSFRVLDFGWSIEDFERAFSEPLGAQVNYGLSEYMTMRRSTAKSQLDPPMYFDPTPRCQYPIEMEAVPNPAKPGGTIGLMGMSSNWPSEPLIAEITDIMGRLRLSTHSLQFFDHAVYFSTQGMDQAAPGTYFVTLRYASSGKRYASTMLILR